MSTDRAPHESQARRRRLAPDDGLLVVGLVGRAGSGKSTVARTLAERGAVVLDADRLGHEITDGDPEVRTALKAEHGDDIYLPDGRLDRRRVGDKVFADAGALARLNALVHPRILARLRERIAALQRERHRGPVIVDAALMLDWGFERECDAVLAVVAPEPVQVARLVAARGWSEDVARRRLDSQHPNEWFERAADVTLTNDGSQEALARQTLAALDRLASRRGVGPAP